MQRIRRSPLHTHVLPLPEALSNFFDRPSYELIHEEAVKAGQTKYIDPETNYTVFTSLAATQRGKCCGNGCRHCPYDFESVKARSPLFRPRWQHHPCEDMNATGASSSSSRSTEVSLVLWGGTQTCLDSLRSFVEFTQADSVSPSSSPLYHLCLVSFYDPRSQLLTSLTGEAQPVDDKGVNKKERGRLHILSVTTHAQRLNIPLLAVPLLPTGVSREGMPADGPGRVRSALTEALGMLAADLGPVTTLVTGHTTDSKSSADTLLTPLAFQFGLSIMSPLLRPRLNR